MYRHLVCANDFYVESLEGMNDALLDNLVDELNVQMEKVKLCIEERAKRGLFAASSVPISMTRPNPEEKIPLQGLQKFLTKVVTIVHLLNCLSLNTPCYQTVKWTQFVYLIYMMKIHLLPHSLPALHLQVGGTSISSFFCWPVVFPT